MCLSVACITSVQISKKSFPVLQRNNLYGKFSTTDTIDRCQQPATSKYYLIYEKVTSVNYQPIQQVLIKILYRETMLTQQDCR